MSRRYDLHPRYFASIGAVRGSERALAGRHGPIGVDAEINLQTLVGTLLETHLPVEFVALAENVATVDAPYFTWFDEDDQFVGAKRIEEDEILLRGRIATEMKRVDLG